MNLLNTNYKNIKSCFIKWNNKKYFPQRIILTKYFINIFIFLLHSFEHLK